MIDERGRRQTALLADKLTVMGTLITVMDERIRALAAAYGGLAADSALADDEESI